MRGRRGSRVVPGYGWRCSLKPYTEHTPLSLRSLRVYDRVVLNPDAISLHCTGRRSKQSSVLRQPRWHPAASIVPIMSLTHTHERSAMIKVNSTVVATNRYLSVDVEITPLVITAAVFDLAIRRLAVMFPTACPINLVIAPPHSVTVWAVSCSPAAVQSGRLAVHAVDKELDLSAVGDLDGFRDPIAAVLSGDTFLTTPIVAFTVPHNIPAPRNRRGGCRCGCRRGSRCGRLRASTVV